jgi:hypothetical protein
MKIIPATVAEKRNVAINIPLVTTQMWLRLGTESGNITEVKHLMRKHTFVHCVQMVKVITEGITIVPTVVQKWMAKARAINE